MQNKANKGRNGWTTKISRRGLIGIFTIVCILIGVAVTLSMRKAEAQKTVADAVAPGKPSTKPTGHDLVTRNSVGQLVVKNKATGQSRFLTQDEAARLAEGLKKVINNSADGLVAVTQDDGSISMDLDGHFQNVMLAKVDKDGNLAEECVDNLNAAAAFFEIDPALLGVPATVPTNSVSR